MSRYIGGIIHPTARYRTQTSSQSRGVWDMKEQYQHKANGNWHSPLTLFPSNTGQRMPVTLTTVAGGSADDTSAYQVHSESFDAAAAVRTTGRLYFAIKVTASTAFLNDFCIGAVQLTSDDFSTLDKGWSFNVLSDYTDWQYATVTGLNTTSAGFENYTDILAAPSQSFASNVNGISNARISRATGTGSSGTGAADGIASAYSTTSTGTIIDGNLTSTIAQTAGTSFMFTESSGTQSNIRNKWFWTRSPEVTLNGEDDKDLVIVYHAASPSGTGMTDAADEPLFRWWWAA
jgi:hypothetical protein